MGTNSIVDHVDFNETVVSRWCINNSDRAQSLIGMMLNLIRRQVPWNGAESYHKHQMEVEANMRLEEEAQKPYSPAPGAWQYGRLLAAENFANGRGQLYGAGRRELTQATAGAIMAIARICQDMRIQVDFPSDLLSLTDDNPSSVEAEIRLGYPVNGSEEVTVLEEGRCSTVAEAKRIAERRRGENIRADYENAIDRSWWDNGAPMARDHIKELGGEAKVSLLNQFKILDALRNEWGVTVDNTNIKMRINSLVQSMQNKGPR